jgi:hypothetical protein
MKKEILVAVAVIILVLTSLGVYALSGYRTTVKTSTIPSQTIDGKYELEVSVLINYGPFGGTSPLGDAEVWVYSSSGLVAQNATDSDGLVSFYLAPGSYTVLVTTIGQKIHINLTGGMEITIDYAYLYK